jgi:hypothetical protein
MADIVELIPDDEAVFRAWEDGRGPQSLSREFALPVTQIEQILDRMLPVFDAQSQLRAFKRELRRLEDLSGEFFALAKRDKNHESAHLVARLNERICAMRGWSPVNVRIDPLAVQVEKEPDSFEKIEAAIKRVAEQAPPAQRALRERVEQLGPEKALALLNAGNDQLNAGNVHASGAVDGLSAPDDAEPNPPARHADRHASPLLSRSLIECE